MDGEGCIVIGKDRGRGERCTPSYRATLILTQCSSNPIVPLQKLWGVGHVRCCRNNGIGLRDKWVWNIYTNEAVTVLKEILPYMRVKKLQAEGILEFQKNMDEFRGVRPIPKEQLEYREWIKQRISDLNQGVLEVTSYD